MGKTDSTNGERLTCGLEVLSVISSALLAVWGIIPLLPGSRIALFLPALFAFSLMIYSHLVHDETAAEIGVTLNHIGAATRLLALPFLLAILFLFLTGWLSGALHLYDNFIPALILFPLSGIAQQYILQGFVHRRVRMFLDRKGILPVALTASIFSIIHAPNLTLMILTFIGGFIWSLVYDKAPNILVLGISHGITSLAVICSLPPWMVNSLSVGYKHFLYQKF